MSISVNLTSNSVRDCCLTIKLRSPLAPLKKGGTGVYSKSPFPPLGAGRFHSQTNHGFVGVVDGACLPSSSTILYVFGEIGAGTLGTAPTKNETALP